MISLNAFHRFAARRPLHVLMLIGVAVAAVAPGIARLELRTDGHALVPVDDPVVRYDAEVRRRFGVRDLIVLFVRTQDARGIFNPDTLDLVQRLTAAGQALPGVAPHDVFSLATEQSDRVYPGTLNFRPLLDPFPTTEAELQSLKDTLRAFRIYDGTLVSRDSRATAVMIGVPVNADRTRLYGMMQQVVAGESAKTADEIHVIGAPIAEALLGTHILEDLGVPRPLLGPYAANEARVDDAALPVLERARRFIARHVGLVPIAILVMGAVFLGAFRSVTAAALPLIEVAFTLVVVFGLMGWCGTPVYLTLAVLPVILCAMGVTDEIHVFAHYVHRRREHPDESVADSVRAAFDDMLPPVFKTSLASAAGFISFAFSPLPSVRAFGVWTAVGMIVCMALSFLLIPALIVLLRPMATSKPGAALADEPAVDSRLAALARALLRLRWPVLAVVVAALALTPLGLRRIEVQDSWINGFSPYSDYFRSTQYFNDQFFGTHLLMMEVDCGAADLRGTVSEADVMDDALLLPPEAAQDPALFIGATLELRRPGTTGRESPPPGGPLVWNGWSATIVGAERKGGRVVLRTRRQAGSPRFGMRFAALERVEYEVHARRLASPDALRRIDELEDFVRAQSALTVGGVLGPADYLKTTSFIVMARNEKFRIIPDDPERVAWLWEQYRRIRRPERLTQLIDADFGRGLVTVFMNNANYRDTAELMRRIRAFERDKLLPDGIRLNFVGDVPVSQAMIGAIVQTEVWSLAVSLVGVLLVVVVLHRSLRWGVLCLLPCAAAVLGNFAVMGWVGMPLGIATSMFAGMSLGIGVDFAIHLADRHRRRLAQGDTPHDAAVHAVAACGVPILIDGLAVSLGFGVLLLSQVPANAHLGLLSVATFLVALVGTLGVMPILMTLGTRRNAPR